MLVLSRGEGQVIKIGDNIRVTIVEVRGDKVRVGIDAPRDVQVLRAELLEQTPEGSDNDA
jgi:carbon storage regulator